MKNKETVAKIGGAIGIATIFGGTFIAAPLFAEHSQSQEAEKTNTVFTALVEQDGLELSPRYQLEDVMFNGHAVTQLDGLQIATRCALKNVVLTVRGTGNEYSKTTDILDYTYTSPSTNVSITFENADQLEQMLGPNPCEKLLGGLATGAATN